MSKQPPDAPPWVTTLPGVPAAFKPLDPKDAEALALRAIEEASVITDSPMANLASDAQRFLADAERRLITTGAQLTLARQMIEQGQHEAVRMQELHHYRALRDLGRFADTRQAIYEFPYLKAGDFDAWMADVAAVEAACHRLDHWDCDCPREEAALEVESVGHRITEETIYLNRRVYIRDTFDPVVGRVRRLYRCRHCGQMNTRDDAPARQAGQEMARRSLAEKVRAAFPTGVPKGQEVAAPASDHTILK